MFFLALFRKSMLKDLYRRRLTFLASTFIVSIIAINFCMNFILLSIDLAMLFPCSDVIVSSDLVVPYGNAEF